MHPSCQMPHSSRRFHQAPKIFKLFSPQKFWSKLKKTLSFKRLALIKKLRCPKLWMSPWISQQSRYQSIPRKNGFLIKMKSMKKIWKLVRLLRKLRHQDRIIPRLRFYLISSHSWWWWLIVTSSSFKNLSTQHLLPNPKTKWRPSSSKSSNWTK
jgi:hypothetical protein